MLVHKTIYCKWFRAWGSVCIAGCTY